MRKGNTYVQCLCECGLTKYVQAHSLRAGITSGCRKCAQKHRVVPHEVKRKNENDRARERYASDPIYAEKKRAKALTYGRKHPEAAAERARKWALANPERAAVSREANKERASIKSRERSLLVYYGITLAEYTAMLDAQSGRCKICNSLPGKRSLCVDHCHTTGKIRGLLCDSCNRGLGLMKDSAQILFSAIGYLEDNNSNE